MLKRVRIIAPAAAVLALVISSAATAAPPNVEAVALKCTLASNDTGYAGSCRVAGDTNALRLRRTDVLRSGIWSIDVRPEGIWSGTMSAGDHGRSFPVQLQVFSDGSGLLQTVFGWFPTRNDASSTSDLSFDVLDQVEVAPNRLDTEIIKRALAILARPDVWNRNDTRVCSPQATTYSLYCAGQKAVQDVTGAPTLTLIDHRRPALEVLRGVVDDRVKGRDYHHRLMDYNNDPTTAFTDVRSVLLDCLRVIGDGPWLRRHGFSA